MHNLMSVGGGVWRMGGLARRGESLLGACRWLTWRMIWWMVVRREEEGEDCEVEGLELGRAVDACWACGVCAQFGGRAGVALLADCHRWLMWWGGGRLLWSMALTTCVGISGGIFSNAYQRLLLRFESSLLFLVPSAVLAFPTAAAATAPAAAALLGHIREAGVEGLRLGLRVVRRLAPLRQRRHVHDADVLRGHARIAELHLPPARIGAAHRDHRLDTQLKGRRGPREIETERQRQRDRDRDRETESGEEQRGGAEQRGHGHAHG